MSGLLALLDDVAALAKVAAASLDDVAALLMPVRWAIARRRV